MFDHAVADYVGLDRTAYRCLDILDQEGPMTAGRIAERAQLSPGAMTALLDRLEGSHASSATVARAKSTRGSRRSSQRGIHQLARPNSCMSAGTSTIRTTVASRKIAVAI